MKYRARAAARMRRVCLMVWRRADGRLGLGAAMGTKGMERLICLRA